MDVLPDRGRIGVCRFRDSLHLCPALSTASFLSIRPDDSQIALPTRPQMGKPTKPTEGEIRQKERLDCGRQSENY
jgi:hypothetical protein